MSNRKKWTKSSFKRQVSKLLRIDEDTLEFVSDTKIYLAKLCWLIGWYSIGTLPYVVHKLEARMEIFIVLIVLNGFLIVPLVFMVSGLSQYSNRSFIQLWDMAPAWKGIGYIGIVCLFLDSLHNAIFSAYFLHYLHLSIKGDFLWLECPQQNFYTKVCYTYSDKRSIMAECVANFNESYCDGLEWENSAWFYFKKFTKGYDSDSWLGYNSKLLGYEVIVLLLEYIALRKSILSLGNLAPVLIYLPALMHCILLLRAILHFESFEYFQVVFDFKLSVLFKPKTWVIMIVATLCSLNLVYGGVSMYDCQNHFRYPIHLHSIMVTIISGLFNIVYLFIIFCIVGNLNYELNIPFKEIFNMSSQFNFIQCPLVFSYWKEAPKVWAFVFFAANFIVVFRNLVSQHCVLFHMFYEKHTHLVPYCLAFAGSFCILMFIVDVFVNWLLILQTIQRLTSIMEVTIVPLLNCYFCCVITFFYGVGRFVDDMHFMLGFRCNSIWNIYYYIAPFLFITAFVWSTIVWFKELFLENLLFSYILYPIFIIMVSFPIAYFVIYLLIHYKDDSFIMALAPKPTWGPRNEVLKKSRGVFWSHDMTKEYLYRQQRLRSRPQAAIKAATAQRVTFNFENDEEGF